MWVARRAALGGDGLQEIDASATARCDRSLQARHEAVAEIEHQIRLLHIPHLARGELEVVGLDPGRREARHVRLGARDLLGREGERVERSHDLLAAVAGRRAAAARGEHTRRESEGENDSRNQRARRIPSLRIAII